MNKPPPVYTSENTQAAYQLNWSLTLFLRDAIPSPEQWLEPLRHATEPDAVRILEFRFQDERALQFFISTQPRVSPSQMVRSVKGRLQYLVRDNVPKAFQRNYGVYSVGGTNNDRLDAYVAKQPSRHPMADPKVQARIESLQFVDENVNLREARCSSHGRYLHNLHIVLENQEHLHDVSERSLSAVRGMIVRCASNKGHHLARIGLLTNHVHLLLGCNVDDSPQAVAIALMNNIAFTQNMKPVLEFSYYAGTFGPYDRVAIRRQLRL
jgi:REP element-mobilizing transposase RayT